MKYVRCDKCGKEHEIEIIADNDYGCIEKGVSYFEIMEIAIMGKKYDICKKCREKLEEAKSDIEKIFCESMMKKEYKKEEAEYDL